MATKKTTVATTDVVETALVGTVSNVADMRHAMRDVTSIDDALALLLDSGAVIERSEDYGDGFAKADKDTLVGVNLLLLGWTFSREGSKEYVVASAIAQDDRGVRKVVIVDGGAGIFKQLEAITYARAEKNIPDPTNIPLHVKNGLRRSDYTYVDDRTGEEGEGTTFYLNF